MQIAEASGNHFLNNWATLFAADIQRGLEQKFRKGLPIDHRYLPYLSPYQPLFIKIAKASYYVWRHSVIVGSMAASAAVGLLRANPDRCRLLGYAHDGGKMKRTHLYVEDARQGNRADPPVIETFSDLRIMLNHPRLSQKYAWLNGLPDEINDLLIEHHGTVKTRIQLSDNVKIGHPPEDFHYRGPRPSMIDSLIVMCADSVSACFEKQMDIVSWRTQDHSKVHIRKIVDKIFRELQNEGQIDMMIVTPRELLILKRRMTTWLFRFFHYMRLFGTPKPGEIMNDGRLWPEY